METTFLKYFITEGIYVIDGVDKNQEINIVEEPKLAYQEIKKPKTILSETCVVLNDLKHRENGMLQKLLLAIRISKPDYIDQLDIQSGHKNYLVFGDFPTEEKYVIHEKQGIRLLAADDIQQLDTDEALKRKLWNQLQTMFLQT